MGSQVLKLLLRTRNFWLLSPSSSSESSLPSLAMAMEDTDTVDTVVDTMEDTVDTITARGRLRLNPRLMLRPPLPPSLDTDTTVTDMVTVLTDTDTPALTLTVTTVTTARGPLMPSLDIVTTAEGTEATVVDTTDTVTDTDTATTDEEAQEVHVYQSDWSSVQMKLDLRVPVI